MMRFLYCTRRLMGLTVARCFAPQHAGQTTRLPSRLSALAPLLFAMLCTCEAGFSQETKTDDVLSDPVYSAWSKNLEVQRCGVCHYSAGNAFAGRDTDFCRLIETRIWLENDKHAISRRRIEPKMRRTTDGEDSALEPVSPAASDQKSNELSFEMCEQLGYDVTTEAGYARFRDNCLTCHAGYQLGQPSDGFSQTTTNHPGISCNYCHQIGTNSVWIDAHSGVTSKQSWRHQTPEEKAAQGMRALVDARSQADLCMDCHIGNQSKNMFVSHDMYAAGHPPLPGVEMQQFESAMPQHWRTPAEFQDSYSVPADQQRYFKTNFANIGSDAIGEEIRNTYWNTRTMLIGAVESARKSVQLVADSRERFGDYALYDCSACHHELRSPSRRQLRNTDGAPGRPRLTEWPAPLLRLCESLVSDSNELQAAERSLRASVASVPFGDPALTPLAAEDVCQQLSQLLIPLQRLPVDRNVAMRVLKLLAATPESQLNDYQSARQVVWAIQTVEREFADKGHVLPAAIREAVAGLEQTGISTNLPASRAGEIYPEYLSGELPRIAAFDPRMLIERLALLSRLLEE